ncbi:unnamed protein product [Echinostoma caproni]|uniref:J domain-containing protein n=1 Tax=Echinostoma caproni TaxID=27848 RepID=A0A183AII3_9TREM|nr:unnamed protein product [Echinostoma caproni]
MDLDDIFTANPKKCEPNYFYVLGVSPSSTVDQIDAEFRVKARELHPDKNLHEDTITEIQFQLLNRAREVLTDPILSKQYGCWLDAGIGIPFEKWLLMKNQFQTVGLCFLFD